MHKELERKRSCAGLTCGRTATRHCRRRRGAGPQAGRVQRAWQREPDHGEKKERGGKNRGAIEK